MKIQLAMLAILVATGVCSAQPVVRDTVCSGKPYYIFPLKVQVAYTNDIPPLFASIPNGNYISITTLPFRSEDSADYAPYINASFTLKNGVAEGPAFFFSQFDTVFTGTYVNGQRQGIWKFNYDYGFALINYVNGDENGPYSYYEGSNHAHLVTSGNYTGGLRSGSWKFYGPDGKVTEEFQYFADSTIFRLLKTDTTSDFCKQLVEHFYNRNENPYGRDNYKGFSGYSILYDRGIPTVRIPFLRGKALVCDTVWTFWNNQISPGLIVKKKQLNTYEITQYKNYSENDRGEQHIYSYNKANGFSDNKQELILSETGKETITYAHGFKIEPDLTEYLDTVLTDSIADMTFYRIYADKKTPVRLDEINERKGDTSTYIRTRIFAGNDVFDFYYYSPAHVIMTPQALEKFLYVQPTIFKNEKLFTGDIQLRWHEKEYMPACRMAADCKRNTLTIDIYAPARGLEMKEINLVNCSKGELNGKWKITSTYIESEHEIKNGLREGLCFTRRKETKTTERKINKDYSIIEAALPAYEIKGAFKNDLKTGWWIKTSNVEVDSVWYVNGEEKAHSTWKWVANDEAETSFSWKQTRELKIKNTTGKVVDYHGKDTLAWVHYFNDNHQEHGVQKGFYSNGNLQYKYYCVNGKYADTIFTYYKTGSVTEMFIVSPGQKLALNFNKSEVLRDYYYIPSDTFVHGYSMLFYENGDTLCKGKIEYNTPSGRWKFFYPDGKIQYIIDYRDTLLPSFDGERLLPYKAFCQAFYPNGKPLYTGYIRKFAKEFDCRAALDVLKFDIVYTNTWNLSGEQTLKNGTGTAIVFDMYSTRILEGEMKNYLPQGDWRTWNPDSTLNGWYHFENGKLEGISYKGDLIGLGFVNEFCDVYGQVDTVELQRNIAKSKQIIDIDVMRYKNGRLDITKSYHIDLNDPTKNR